MPAKLGTGCNPGKPYPVSGSFRTIKCSGQTLNCIRDYSFSALHMANQCIKNRNGGFPLWNLFPN